jgi:UDP-glucose 4-epimerase
VSGLRIVVTGGAGFVGGHLCEVLAARPEVGAVVVLDDLSAPAVDPPPDLEFVQGSVLDSAALHRALRGADGVAHLAALSTVVESLRDPVGTYRVNALGTATVLEAARRADVRLTVVASSAAVYGNDAPSPTSEDAPTRPVSPYGASKVATEAYALAAQATFGLPALVLRLFNIFGPRQRSAGAVLPSFIRAVLRGDPLPIDGDGSQTRDLVYVRDVCAVMADAFARGVSSSSPVNVGSGVTMSVRDLAEQVAAAAGVPPRFAARPRRDGDVRDSRADTTLLHRLFPDFRPTPLPEALAETVAWFRAAGPGSAPSRHD